MWLGGDNVLVCGLLLLGGIMIMISFIKGSSYWGWVIDLEVWFIISMEGRVVDMLLEK